MRRQRGFTLLELLLVVFILAALAATTSSMIDGAHEQARFDDTEARLKMLRRGIVGVDDPSVGVAGYVADVGTLPEHVNDLLVKPDAVPLFGANDPDYPELHFGWRGPYVHARPRYPRGVVDVLEFPDGWGSPDLRDYTDENSVDADFGWRYITAGTAPDLTLTITSRGASQVYDDGDDQVEQIKPLDYLVDLAGWMVRARVNSSANLDPTKLALRVLWPDGDGALAGVVADPNEILALGLPDDSLEANITGEVTFQIAPSPARKITAGPRLVVLCREDAGVFQPISGQVALVEFKARGAKPVTISRRFEVPAP